MKAQSERANASLAGTELQFQSWKQFGHAYSEQPESWIVLRNTSANHQAKKPQWDCAPLRLRHISTGWPICRILQPVLRLAAFPRRVWQRRQRQRGLVEASALVQEIACNVPPAANSLPPSTWNEQQLVPTLNETAVSAAI